MNTVIELPKMNVNVFVTDNRIFPNVVIPRLSHGDSFVEVITGTEELQGVDAIMTRSKSLALGIATADCAPVCYSDGDRVAIAHVGWRGLCLGLIEKVLSRMDAEKLEVFVGPHLHSFEIQRDFCYDAIIAKFGEQFITHENGKMIFNFKGAIASCLPIHTEFDQRNTGTDFSLPSHRRDGTSTRILTIVQFKK